MTDLTLTIGNKNYSSWSLRPWLAAKAGGIAFDEVLIPLYVPGSREEILSHSAAGKVPVLHHGPVTVWESLAVCEYLAETFPNAGLWPDDKAARAAARAVATEMHNGFLSLRRHLPMNIRRVPSVREIPSEVQADIDRVTTIWRDCRTRYGKGGDCLFGHFTIADAMYAPVVSRFRSYCVPLGPLEDAYCAAIMALPAMREWVASAKTEPWMVDNFEV
ncbi:MAG TPA: glutathione S-transferase family protein [Stellaceae bacterium]|jgi:glutathione S-transferase